MRKTKAKNNGDAELAAARKFNSAVTAAIRQNGLTPAHHQLYRLCDCLPAFAREIIESAIGNSENVTPSTFILGGLRCLGLEKPNLLPSKSQIRELDRYHHNGR